MKYAEEEIRVYLESGAKKTIAGAVDWPGWCRAGHDEASALQALFDYAPRYASVLSAAKIPIHPPVERSALTVVEWLQGNSSTDYGVPVMSPSRDAQPVTDADLELFEKHLAACWQALETAAQAAQGVALTKGPRGGGRELGAILEHVYGAHESYLSSLGWKSKGGLHSGDAQAGSLQSQREVMDVLAASARGELPKVGPRGGTRWTARYFVRRAAWHILDHAWEIEDRSKSE